MMLSFGRLAECVRYSSILGISIALAACFAAKVPASSNVFLLLRIGVTCLGLEVTPDTTLADALDAKLTKSLRESADDGWAVGEKNTIIHWDGTKWTRFSEPSGAAVSAIDMVSSDDGWAVGQELLIDCDDDAGLTMAALRAGCRKLAFSGTDDEWQRLNQIAARYRAEIRGPADRSPPCLALSPDDDAKALQAWLNAQTTG